MSGTVRRVGRPIFLSRIHSRAFAIGALNLDLAQVNLCLARKPEEFFQLNTGQSSLIRVNGLIRKNSGLIQVKPTRDAMPTAQKRNTGSVIFRSMWLKPFPCLAMPLPIMPLPYSRDSPSAFVPKHSSCNVRKNPETLHPPKSPQSRIIRKKQEISGNVRKQIQACVPSGNIKNCLRPPPSKRSAPLRTSVLQRAKIIARCEHVPKWQSAYSLLRRQQGRGAGMRWPLLSSLVRSSPTTDERLLSPLVASTNRRNPDML